MPPRSQMEATIAVQPETALPVLPPEYGTTKTYRYGKIKLTVITRGNN